MDKSKQEKKSSSNFFQTLLSNLFGSKDPNVEKRKKLKGINKKLSKCKYNKFYKHYGNEATPLLAKLFYDLYKAIYPTKKVFENIKNPNSLKKIVIFSGLTAEQRKIEESLSEENIKKISKEIPLENIKNQIEQRISLFNDSFTAEKITKLDLLYKQLIALKDFCLYDFYFTLKKFDKSLVENNFSISPRFEKINAEYIVDDLKDFISIAWAIPFETEWEELIKLLKIMTPKETLSINTLKKILLKLQSIKTSQAFEMIIQLASEDPLYKLTLQTHQENIVEPYLDMLKTDAFNVINKLLQAEQQSKTSSLLEQIFGSSNVNHLYNYTAATSSTLEAKGLNSFIYANPLNYLKTFLIEVVKTDLRSFYELVIVRGKWDSPTLYSPFSNAYHSLFAISDQITTFDEELSKEKSNGLKIKNLLPKVERDNTSKNIVNRIINDSNDNAYNYIIESMRNLISIGKSIKNLIEDQSKQKPELISNWAELNHYSETSIKEFSINLYKKIYLFTTLIQTNLKTNE